MQIPDNIRDIASEGVSGDYTEEQALKQILNNTGVVYTIVSPNNVSLKLRGPAETVEVADENSTPFVAEIYRTAARYSADDKRH